MFFCKLSLILYLDREASLAAWLPSADLAMDFGPSLNASWVQSKKKSNLKSEGAATCSFAKVLQSNLERYRLGMLHDF